MLVLGPLGASRHGEPGLNEPKLSGTLPLDTNPQPLLGGSWDLVSKVISTLIGVISNYKYSYLIYNPTY